MIKNNNSIKSMRNKAIDIAGTIEVLTDEKESLKKKVADNRITELVAKEKTQEIDSRIINESHEAKKSINKDKEDYIELLRKAHEPSGDRVHEDIRLLESGYPLTMEELETLRNKHLNNIIMLKILEKYSQDNDIYFKEVPTLEEKVEALNSIEEMLLELIRDPEGYTGRIVKTDSAWERQLGRYSELIGDGTNIL